MGESLFWPGGGSGSGGTLVVTAPVGTTVTATNGVKAITKPVNSEGIAIFRGLASGTWQLSCSDGTTTSTPVSVEIVADYTQTLAFFSATINVTFPVGSTCTATCGTVQLTASAAESASGSAVFGVPNAGTWTITSTANDGSGDSATAEVEITTEGQSESVELSYTLVIYKPGDVCADITGGWENYSNTTVTKGDEYLKVVPTKQYSSGFAGTANTIDLTDIATLYFDAKNNAAEDGYLVVGVSATKGGSFKAKSSYSPSQAVTKAVNVASLTGEYYIQVEVYWGQSIKGDGRIYNVWGEPG